MKAPLRARGCPHTDTYVPTRGCPHTDTYVPKAINSSHILGTSLAAHK